MWFDSTQRDQEYDMKSKETFDKAYGHIPKEVNYALNFDDLLPRGIRYYWVKFKRWLTR